MYRNSPNFKRLCKRDTCVWWGKFYQDRATECSLWEALPFGRQNQSHDDCLRKYVKLLELLGIHYVWQLYSKYMHIHDQFLQAGPKIVSFDTKCAVGIFLVCSRNLALKSFAINGVLSFFNLHIHSDDEQGCDILF